MQAAVIERSEERSAENTLAEPAQRSDQGLVNRAGDSPVGRYASGCVAVVRSGELDDSLYTTASPPIAKIPAAAMTPTRSA
jgi:hypothetical protein